MLGDIQSRRLLIAKAILFGVLGLAASVLVIVVQEAWREAIFLVIAVWAFCRLYYFLFYVIEKYIDGDYRFSGIWSAIRFLKTREPTEEEP